MLFYPFVHRHDLPPSDLNALLGGKGAGLAMMAGELALPVPPGFTLTTRACLDYLERGWTDELEQSLRRGVAQIEAATGRGFGDGRAPLLLSVRSGAPISMPGMLDSILNVGLDAQTQRGLGDEDTSFADDCRQRLESSFASSVGTPPPADCWSQLRTSIEAVFRSAQSPRASAYRRREGLAEDPLTAVNVQTMVFGNRDEASASGVLFSRDPATGEARLYGDVLFRAQGEDVVSGRQRTLPIDALEARLPEAARRLREITRRLEQRLRDLCEIEFTIESGRLWLLQVRAGKRSPRAALRIALDLANEPGFPLDRREAVERVLDVLADPPPLRFGLGADDLERGVAAVGQGLGASPGVACGELVVDVEAALRCAAEGRAVILARPETSPSDVEGMQVARGLLTVRGGLASHAAVIARGWGIPAVVSVEGLSIDAQGIELAGRRFEVGETLSIDGASGGVFAGALPTAERVLPEVELLRDWARALGVEIPIGPLSRAASAEAGAAPTGMVGSDRVVEQTTMAATATAHASGAAPPDAPAPALDLPGGSASSAEAILRSLAIKGTATREALAAALGPTPEALDPLLEALSAAGTLAPARPLGLGLTREGRATAETLLEADRVVFGLAAARGALDAFQPLDARLKQAVSDWQLRPVAGEILPNDHADADWDAGVLERLEALCQEVELWLAGLADGLPRLRRYAERLEAALRAMDEGDTRFVASPRVDSIHGIWFELHEELIRLAGSTRAAELEAGRAG